MIETGINSLDVAFQISTRAFLNSLMREWNGWELLTGSCEDERDDTGRGGAGIGHGMSDDATMVRFPLPSRGSHVDIEIVHVSRVGQHGFRLPLRERRDGAAVRVVGFPEFAAMIAAEPAIVGSAGSAAALTFLRRVLQSVSNVDDVLSHVSAPTVVLKRDPSFIESEQALRFGHSVHPTPRSRDEFTREDSRRFAAEYGQGFALRWWSARPEIVAHGASRGATAPQLSMSLLAEDRDPAGERLRAAAAEGRVLLPMHPWQAAQLAQESDIAGLFRDGLLIDHGPAGSPWFATSSLRSIYAPQAPWMLKSSLSLRLTNSARIIKEIECRRGLVIDALLASGLGDELAERFPDFSILGEPGYLALRGTDGTVLAQTIVAFRDNPFRGETQPGAAVLAALCEIYPDGRGSALTDTILRIAEGGGSAEALAHDWFRRFLERAVGPLLAIQSDYGLLFGAHQQNLVIGLEDGWPGQVFFRDCQGTGYVSEFLPALQRRGPELDLAAGHIFGSDEAARIMGYYLIVNSVFAVIGALALGGLAREESLVATLRAFIEGLAAQPLRDKTCLDYLLRAPHLGSKGNFMICFKNINENTDVTDPLAGYVAMPNPIAEVRP